MGNFNKKSRSIRSKRMDLMKILQFRQSLKTKNDAELLRENRIHVNLNRYSSINYFPHSILKLFQGLKKA